jgi:Flp pilus assembly protein TadG
MRRAALRILSDCGGQSLLEFAIVMPLLLLLALGVTEFGYVLLDEHIVTKITREGSNLISRDTTLQDATTALTNMSTRPVNFSTDSRVIFSVLKKVATVGAANYDQTILYQRHSYGAITAQSQLNTQGGGSFGGAPDYVAVNSDNNTALRVTNLPAGLNLTRGSMVYVTEVYTRHTRITPLDRLGVSVPTTLYSIAYF